MYEPEELYYGSNVPPRCLPGINGTKKEPFSYEITNMSYKTIVIDLIEFYSWDDCKTQLESSMFAPDFNKEKAAFSLENPQLLWREMNWPKRPSLELMESCNSKCIY